MRQRERRKKSATSYGPPLWLSLQQQFQLRGQPQSPRTPTCPEHEVLAPLTWPATTFCAPTGEGAAVQPEMATLLGRRDRYGELLHLLHALVPCRWFARFSDLMRRDW